eukprot:Platyproteum_vivax@DN3762_c0_g1_i1.p1
MSSIPPSLSNSQKTSRPARMDVDTVSERLGVARGPDQNDLTTLGNAFAQNLSVDKMEGYFEGSTISQAQLVLSIHASVQAVRELHYGKVPSIDLLQQVSGLLTPDGSLWSEDEIMSLLPNENHFSKSSEDEKANKACQLLRDLIDPDFPFRDKVLVDEREAYSMLKLLNLKALQKQLRTEVMIQAAQTGPPTPAVFPQACQNLQKVLLKKGTEKTYKLMSSELQCDSLSKDLKAVTDKVHSELQKAMRIKNPAWVQYDNAVSEIAQHYRKIMRERSLLRDHAVHTAKLCRTKWDQVTKKQKQLLERAEKDRLRSLKEGNIEEYLALVRKTKNKRVQELLEQTDNFLQEMGARVLVQQTTVVEPKKKKEKKTKQVEEEKVESVSSEETKQPTDGDQSVAPELKQEKYYQVSHSISEIVEVPMCLKGPGPLMPYQKAGLEWLVSLYNNKLHGILADEMGLGKTIQTIALLAYLKENKSVWGPHLIIVPLSTMPNWESEFARWCPSLHVLSYKGLDRKTLARTVRSVSATSAFNVCLTTYEYAVRDKNVLSYPRWQYIVVDEGHRMKNHKSKFHIALADFNSSHRLLLTGTPLQNNLTELWSLLNFLLPQIFKDAADFERWFSEPFEQLPSAEKAAKLTEEESLLIIHRLHNVLRPFLLRRVKGDVLAQLPEKQEHIVRVDLSEWQKVVYEQVTSKCLRQVDEVGKVGTKSLNNTMMQLRKTANHPFLFLTTWEVNEDIYRVSGKVEVVDRMLPKLFHFNHKVLIFSQMTALLDILGEYLDFRGYSFVRLDGSVGMEDRRTVLSKFNDGEASVFLLSTRAGGLGLNLQVADTVILFDSDFNPHVDSQAQARAHRMGQTKEVRVFRLVTLTPIEEGILARADKKSVMDQKVIQAGLFNSKATDSERKEHLQEMLRGREDDQKHTATTPLELNKMLARSDEELEFFNDYDLKMNLPIETTDKNGDTNMTEPEDKPYLIATRRLISAEEIPPWVAAELEEEEDEVDDKTSRRTKANLNRIWPEQLSERDWVRMMQDGEDGFKTKVKRKRSTLSNNSSEDVKSEKLDNSMEQSADSMVDQSVDKPSSTTEGGDTEEKKKPKRKYTKKEKHE